MKHKEVMNILCATDDNYVALCGIMLTSLYLNNRDINIHVYLLTEGINENDSSKLKQTAKQYNATLTILKVEASQFSHCPLWPGDHLSIAAYYRLMASSLLPDSVDKILYLDCDIIVNGSLKSLWNLDIENSAIGAVPDAEFYNEEFYHRLHLPKNKIYFNSGVLLINLKYWRMHNVENRCFACIEQQRDVLLFHDQDTLNVVLQDEVKVLPLQYNLQTPFLLADFSKHYVSGVTVSSILAASKCPPIIHYIGGGKPWNGHSRHPFRKHFYYYKSLSFWNNVSLFKKQESIISKIRWFILNFMWNTGLKSAPKTYIIETQSVCQVTTL